jgi:hypothetical protein
MRDATQEDLAILRYEEEDQMDHSQYRHFLSRAQEGAEVVVMPVGDRDCIGCFTDQVKLTCATSVNDFSWKSCKNTWTLLIWTYESCWWECSAQLHVACWALYQFFLWIAKDVTPHASFDQIY